VEWADDLRRGGRNLRISWLHINSPDYVLDDISFMADRIGFIICNARRASSSMASSPGYRNSTAKADNHSTSSTKIPSRDAKARVDSS